MWLLVSHIVSQACGICPAMQSHVQLYDEEYMFLLLSQKLMFFFWLSSCFWYFWSLVWWLVLVLLQEWCGYCLRCQSQSLVLMAHWLVIYATFLLYWLISDMNLETKSSHECSLRQWYTERWRCQNYLWYQQIFHLFDVCGQSSLFVRPFFSHYIWAISMECAQIKFLFFNQPLKRFFKYLFTTAILALPIEMFVYIWPMY